jgi:hypothetical protein
VDPAIAHRIARDSHRDDVDRFGEPMIEHVERVAAAVPEDARTLAFLHDLLEHTDTSADELISQGLTPIEFAALELVTRSSADSYESYVLRIAHARGSAGDLARVVKLADLDDRLAQPSAPGRVPPYGWARLHLSAGQERAEGRAA